MEGEDVARARIGIAFVAEEGFDAEGFSVHELEVIAGASREWDFTEGNSAARREIHRLEILHDPAARDELRVDLFAGALFRG